MAEPLTDDRLDAILASLATDLDVPDPGSLHIASMATRMLDDGRRTSPRWPATPRRILAAAAVVLVVLVGVVLIVAPAREAVARWFGLDVERDDHAVATGSFADGVAPLDVARAIATTDLDPERVGSSALGAPDAAGVPPEGGVLLSWDDGTTLWVREVGDDITVVKRLGEEDRAVDVPGVGDYAVLIDGEHVLDTPARRVAADRVLWWIGGDREHRLESDRPAAELTEIAQALAG